MTRSSHPDRPLAGRRIEMRRRQRGLSRKVVANLVGRSEEWLRLVESGQRRLDSIDVLARLAVILQVHDVAELIDWPNHKLPRPTGKPPDELHQLRQVVIDHPALRVRDDPPVETHTPQPLSSALRECRRIWTTAPHRYSQVSARLPALIAVARTAHWQRRDLETAAQLIDAYHLARDLLTAAGDHRTAATVADRALEIAAQVRQPLFLAASAWHVADGMLHADDPMDGHDYALTAAHRLAEAELTCPDAEILGEALRLLAAHGAALAGDLAESARLLEQAGLAARARGHDRAARGIPFGPVELGIAEVNIALAQHDPDQAIRLARRVCLTEEQALGRRAAYHIDQARAYILRREDAEATIALMKIATISPEDLYYDADARNCVQHLVRRDNYLTRTEVAHLADLAGITR
ncbi:helix-turn-helix domain-containing protein [Nocardia sp. NPDC052566]|uniref:helix-turn-helix domain-containing protein n=1 Tax=Nocardia sp. NPDC052566 TaxID=3364330 RepID=UPI0037C54976